MNLRTRCISRASDVFLYILANIKPLSRISLASVLADKTEKLLNLPGQLPFSFEDWVNASVPNENGDLLLPMNIEGGEHGTLLSIR